MNVGVLSRGGLELKIEYQLLEDGIGLAQIADDTAVGWPPGPAVLRDQGVTYHVQVTLVCSDGRCYLYVPDR